MGKPENKPLKKMAELVTERRKPAVLLKRSKSVRSSLRIFGAKLLQTHQKHHEEPIQKTPSLSSLNSYKRTFSYDDKMSSMTILPDFYAKESVNTILKTPMVKFESKYKTKREKVKITTPPLVIAPKAAQLLQIPLRDNPEPLSLEYDNVFFNNNIDLPEDVISDQLDSNVDYRRKGFHRTALRLSLATTRRKRTEIEAEYTKLPTLQGELEMQVATMPLNRGLPPGPQKHNKKEAKLIQQRLERLAKVNNHIPALFDAVQHGYLEKARTILESTDVDVNSLNSDGLSPLDVAVLSNNRPLVKMLVSFGAREGNQCCAGGDTEKQAVAWGRRAKSLKRLVLGFAQARPPDPPSLVALDISSCSTVAVRLQEPTASDSPITTKFKVQWSTRADFSIITGEKEILEISNPNCTIELTQGRRYFFRAACGNLKGFGAFFTSTPSSVVPSTWRAIERKEERFGNQLKQLDELMEEVKQFRPGSEILETQNSQRRVQKKKTTIKQLFTAASKFQKHLRRGIYLACILYHEDKVLVTNEDFLPVIEIDETFPSCIHTDLHWLMKIACTWDDTKLLRSEMEKHSSSAIHFRTKLLTAAMQMQSSLCLQDLGQLYYKPLRDSQGTMVLSTINYVKTPKSVSVLNSRWLPMNKVFKKMVLSDDHSISEILMASIQEQINYHQVSSLKLSRGLYLAYLKMQSSVDMIQVVVSSKSPNMLPHCKIRDNPHVSAEEWEYLKQQHLPDILDNATELQRTFLELVTSAAKRLFNYMDISNEDANIHRLFDTEVIDLTDEVSFIVVCPSAEFSCSVPGQREILLQRGDLLSLPLQVFEMIHLNTYQNSIIRKYSKLSCLLELDAATASHLHREAFSNSEVAIAKERLTKLQDLQTKLNTIWKSVRWLMEVISFARDRVTCGMSMRFILEKESGMCTSPKRSLLQIPPRDTKSVKSTPGRGSWPGPGASNITPGGSLINEFSKSEQHLSTNENTQYLSACSDPESRKNSDSYNSDYFSQNLPPSRSEDILFSIPTSTTQQRFRTNTISSISATTSPMLGTRSLRSGSMLSVNTLNTTNTSDSMHSFSSDSDDCLHPMSSSTPNRRHRSKMVPSKSMSNVKQNILDISTRSERTRPKQLNFDPNMLHSNLESSLSKSLSNIKSFTDVDYPSATYLKPMDLLRPPESVDNFKIPDVHPQSSSKDLASGILQVYAAYETGLATGTSLKLHVTPRTTAREVVDLVVKQLNMAVVLKGKEGPIYNIDKLKNFCLVAVIGARERCLRDDFKPLQLQNPWKKGRLYVRQKHDVLAALEHSSKHSTII
ncbi:ankyrin repeat and fibronectin type III domain containing protein wide awake isoform X3 [Leptinotarsa decemlineata]|uniref:ankyrin repeat and fibronectin type III domain containing protein wide awake isoform X3 n=1 Tax=Leptinotarsa decemlineata TaxID=7539 RepID=UPI003D30D48E